MRTPSYYKDVGPGKNFPVKTCPYVVRGMHLTVPKKCLYSNNFCEKVNQPFLHTICRALRIEPGSITPIVPRTIGPVPIQFFCRAAGNQFSYGKFRGMLPACRSIPSSVYIKLRLFLSGCWESNPVYLLPKETYYRYTTARIDYRITFSRSLHLALFPTKSISTVIASNCQSLSPSHSADK